MKHIGTIHPTQRFNFQKKIAKLNKRARKLGLPEITCAVSEPYLKEIPNDDPKAPKRYEEVCDAEVSGDSPKIAGWSLVGVLDLSPELDLVVVRPVPGDKVPDEYRDMSLEDAGWCDHCKSVRRRNDTFVLRHEDGRHVRVGRKCLKDFLGHQSPEALMRYAKWSFDPEMFAGFSGGGTPRWAEVYPLPMVLEYVLASVEARGFVSTSNADPDRESTSSQVKELMGILVERFNTNSEAIKWAVKFMEDYKREAHKAEAEKVLEWLKQMPEEEARKSDYILTLKRFAEKGYCRWSDIGWVASMPTAYAKAMDRIREKATRRPSEYVGTVGKRDTFELKYETHFSFETMYGRMTLVKTLDREGNVVMLKINPNDMPEGDFVKVKGTVKQHKEYKGVKQTVLNRAQVVA